MKTIHKQNIDRFTVELIQEKDFSKYSYTYSYVVKLSANDGYSNSNTLLYREHTDKAQADQDYHTMCLTTTEIIKNR